MQKIPSLFKRDYEGNRLVYNEVVEGCEWVVKGEGVATRKLDGTCCMIKDGVLYKRREVKKGKKPPKGFIPATEIDPETGKQQGWLVVQDIKENRWHLEAWNNLNDIKDGTYELLGPKIQGNPEGTSKHILIPHSSSDLIMEKGSLRLYTPPPRDYEGLKEWFKGKDIEGIVWHHPDGRMAKIKKKDFGLKRKG